jgi:beta-glucosidase
MKKGLKITLKIIAVIVTLLIIVGVGIYLYINSKLLDFEGDYTENTNIKELTIDGYAFQDRNDNNKLDIYEDDRKPTNDRIDDLLAQMTIEEKIHLLKGSGLASALGRVKPGQGIPGAVGTIVPTPRLGIPTIYLSDGPAGLRIEPTRDNDERTYYCTAFPIATLLASSWNVPLVEKVGIAMGNEALEYGLDVILGPGVNIQRHPFCGRNFEYYSEDPILTGYMGAAIVNGIESNGVGTSVKHFVANNQETERKNNDVIVSDRALREIYLKSFEIIVQKSQPMTIMSSYNKVNGSYVAESRDLLTTILREEWGFEGLVMSDWLGGRDAPGMIRAGNDLLEPGTKEQWKVLIKAHKKGELPLEAIDTSVRRILKLIIESKKMQQYKFTNQPNLEAHSELTRQSASEGMVLLKNNGSLPLQANNNVALIGITSYDFIAGGTGSGDVNEAYSISLDIGLENAGFTINAEAKQIFENHREANAKEFIKPEGIRAMFEPYIPPKIIYSSEQLEKIGASADIGIITIGRNSGEGGDRIAFDNFLLSQLEKDMIENTCKAFHKVGKKVIVVLNIGGVIETASWKELPDAILLVWQGGQEGGNSAADILSGKINPSGKLPMTFPINFSDHASDKNFPQEGGSMKITGIIFPKEETPEDEKIRNIDYTVYEEGIYVGYRHFDKANLEVSFPFGYGLSYTDFEYGEMDIIAQNDTLNIFLDIKNKGGLKGKEVVQFYVSMPSSKIDRANKELKAFIKTETLKPGETTSIKIQIPVSELRYWNETTSKWILENGIYNINVGASSRDIRQTKSVSI